MSRTGTVEFVEVDQVVVRARPLDQRGRSRSVGRALSGERAELAQERAQLLGHRLGLVDQRLEVVEGGAEVHEGRVGLAHEWGQLGDGVLQRGALAADRLRGLGEVVDEPGQVGWRAARSVTSLPLEWMKRRSWAGSLLRASNRRADEAIAGLRYSQPALAALLLPAYVLVKPRISWESALRWRGPKMLKIWSRSTAVVVCSVPRTPPGGARVRAWAGLQVDVAVGDTGERGLADDRLGAVAERPVLVVEREGDLRLAVAGQLDVLDRPDGGAADLDLVALDQLGGVDEPRLVGVVVVAGSEQHDDNSHHCR